jgi:hypothetical protein
MIQGNIWGNRKGTEDREWSEAEERGSDVASEPIPHGMVKDSWKGNRFIHLCIFAYLLKSRLNSSSSSFIGFLQPTCGF